MALFFHFVAWLPQDPAWGLGQAFSAILGPVWRIVVASIVAELCSELIDTEIYHLWQTRVTQRFQWMRVYKAILLDTGHKRPMGYKNQKGGS